MVRLGTARTAHRLHDSEILLVGSMGVIDDVTPVGASGPDDFDDVAGSVLEVEVAARHFV